MKKIVLEHKTQSKNVQFISAGYEECTSTHSVGPIKKSGSVAKFKKK